MKLDYEQKRSSDGKKVYTEIGKSENRALTKFAADDLVKKAEWMNVHLLPGRGLVSSDVFTTVMHRELEREERLSRMKTDKGVIANLQVLELDLFMSHAIKMQRKLSNMENNHGELIDELNAIGQLPQSQIEQQDEKVWALENIFRQQDADLDGLKPSPLLEHFDLEYKKLDLPSDKDFKEIPRNVRDIGWTRKQEKLEWS